MLIFLVFSTFGKLQKNVIARVMGVNSTESDINTCRKSEYCKDVHVLKGLYFDTLLKCHQNPPDIHLLSKYRI